MLVGAPTHLGALPVLTPNQQIVKACGAADKHGVIKMDY